MNQPGESNGVETGGVEEVDKLNGLGLGELSI
jgi:hypothetical protein